MERFHSGNGRLRLCVPSAFVVPPIPPEAPPPFPGTVTFEDIRPPTDPPLPFLVPWKQFAHTNVAEAMAMPSANAPLTSVPCDVDEATLGKHNERHDVRATVEAVFKAHKDPAALVDAVMQSLASPFAPRKHEDGGGIVWTIHRAIRPNPSAACVLGGKKLTHRHRILKGPAWSVVSYGEPQPDALATNEWFGCVRRNVVYDGHGDAVAQIDFGHGAHCGIHCHALVEGNLEHTPGYADDHMFVLRSVPWFWTCVPDVRSTRLWKHWKEHRRLPSDDDVDDDDEFAAFQDDADDCVSEGLHCVPAAERDRRCGARLFGLASTEAIDDCTWTPVNVLFESW